MKLHFLRDEHKDLYIKVFIMILFIKIFKRWKQPKCVTERGLVKYGKAM